MMPAGSSREPQAGDESHQQDFDLHGVVGVRLLDATPGDVAVVRRQLGPLEQPFDREADITVRFVDRATSHPLTHVGLHETGFNDDGFFLLQGKAGVDAKARIPFDRIGDRLEIVCERAMPAVPHLLTLINLVALSKGVLPLHASALTVGTTGILITGWSKGGKTESLLSGMTQPEAQYVGDEWVYLTHDGRMLGVPEPIRVWAWHLDQLPTLLRSRPWRERLRLASWARGAALAGALSKRSLPAAGLLRRAAPIVARQAYLQIPPAELFGAASVALRGRLDAVVLVVSHESSDITVQPVAAAEISARMAASLADERAAFMAHYRQFRYACPEGASRLVDTAEAIESRLLSALLDPHPAVCVSHPYPCDIAALGRTVVDAAVAAADGRSSDFVPCV